MAEQKVEQLRQHFQNVSPDQQAKSWEAMWQQKVTPWDRSQPNQALIDALKDNSEVFGSSLKEDGTRKKALIPGCGGGYDVVLLSSYGYDALGLDTASTAIKNARALQTAEEKERKDYPIPNDEIGAGQGTFLEANFFEDDFLSSTKQFDLIYDYTFLCALPPTMRPRWAKRMSDLLASGGTLICVEFPLGKPLSAGGPPHGLTSQVYTELFKSPGKEIDYDNEGQVMTNGSAGAQELKRIAHWSPSRSHHTGQGKDMVSLWQHV